MLEYQVLCVWFNFYFVFNVFNNLCVLIYEDLVCVCDMVIYLLGILCYVLIYIDVGWVVLVEEWWVVQDYLVVEVIYYEVCLCVWVDIEIVVLVVCLLLMVLQLLVENVIKYGIVVICGGGDLQIVVCLVVGQLYLQVCNLVGIVLFGEGYGVGLVYLCVQLGIGDGQVILVQGWLQLLCEGDVMLVQLEVWQ